MEQIKESFKKVLESEEYQKGKQEFHDRKVVFKNSVKCDWYKMTLTGEQWKKLSQSAGFTMLKMERQGKTVISVDVGFLAVNPPRGATPIVNEEDLLKIQSHREIANTYPRPLETVEK